MKIQFTQDAYIRDSYHKKGEIISWEEKTPIPEYAKEYKTAKNNKNSNKELEDLRLQAAEWGIEFEEDTSVETLKQQINVARENAEYFEELKKQAVELNINIEDSDCIDSLIEKISEQETKNLETKKQFNELVNKASTLNIPVTEEDTVESLTKKIEELTNK